jgi:GntR family transcriptional regulator / MocR family aminotransferase
MVPIPDMPIATLNMVRLDRRQRESLQSQLYRQVRDLIMSGQLAKGIRLPSTRDLVGQLGTSRNTIVYAFERLVAEGYLDTRVGSGVFVADLRLNTNPRATTARVNGPPTHSPSISTFEKIRISPDYPTSRVRPFRPCQPAVDEFPLRTWNRARSIALRLQRTEIFFEADSAGAPRLRRALATYLRDARGVRCDAEQVIITSGAQQALSLIGATLIEPNEPVWIEDPGYLGARAALMRAGGALVPIPIDNEGMRIPPLNGITVPRLIYVTPSRQFPLGTTMSLPRRLALLEFARTNGAWVIEDDYDSEFRYVDRPLPSLQGLANNECVIYVGSFSKVLFASLRLGYLVVPPQLVDVFRNEKAVMDGSTHVIDQATAAVFIQEGFLSTHVRNMRGLYRERRDFFLLEANRQLGGAISFPPVEAGMDAIGWLAADTDDVATSKRIAAVGVDTPPLSAYSLNVGPPGLVFGFTAYPASAVRSAIQRIGRCLSVGQHNIR